MGLGNAEKVTCGRYLLMKGRAMSVSQPPKDTPFGLEPNIAAGLAYVLGILGGIIMLVGGGTNKFVKWAAAQSITLGIVVFGSYIVIMILSFLLAAVHLGILSLILWLVEMVVFFGYIAFWLWGTITGFQGKEVRFPIVAGVTESLFKSML